MHNPQPYFLVFADAGIGGRLRNTLGVAAIGCPVLPGFRARPPRVRPPT